MEMDQIACVLAIGWLPIEDILKILHSVSMTTMVLTPPGQQCPPKLSLTDLANKQLYDMMMPVCWRAKTTFIFQHNVPVNSLSVLSAVYCIHFWIWSCHILIFLDIQRCQCGSNIQDINMEFIFYPQFKSILGWTIDSTVDGTRRSHRHPVPVWYTNNHRQQ